MSATDNRKRCALVMAFVLISVCMSFSFPAFLDGDANADVPKEVVIVPGTTEDSPIEDIILDYAMISSETKHQESMGRDPRIVDPGMPSDKDDRKVVEEMRDMIGDERFIPKDEAPDEPVPAEGMPEKRGPHPETVRMDEKPSVPDASFIEDIADFMDDMGDERLGDIADDMRSRILWLALMDLNDALSTAACPASDRKDNDSAEEADEDIHLEEDTGDDDEIPSNDPPSPAPTVYHDYDGGIPPFYYSGVTTSG